MNIPPALVLGCNTQHGIGVLSDWIEEHMGFAPDFFDRGWANVPISIFTDELRQADYTQDNGNGRGDGRAYGYSTIGTHVEPPHEEYVAGKGNGVGNLSYWGNGFGSGYGNRDGTNSETRDGFSRM